MKYHAWINTIWFLLAILGIGYYVLLSVLYGLNNIVFSWTFLLIGGCFLGLAIIEKKQQRHLHTHLPKFMNILLLVVFTIGFTIFFTVEMMIITAGTQPSAVQSETAIVLGAQLKGAEISRLLAYRLDTAVTFYHENADATIIVSGGQGLGESQSEASAMKEYLVKHGVPATSILMENKSRNTSENFAFSKKLLKNDTHVSVITNDFHMYRSSFLCKENGLTCSLYPARSDLDLAPNFYFREFFAVIKEYASAILK